MTSRLAGLAVLAVFASLSTFGCATTPRPRIADVNAAGRGSDKWVSFDEKEVWGGSVSLSRRSDGSWAGRLGGKIIDARVEKDELIVDPVNRVAVHRVDRGYLLEFGREKVLVFTCTPGDQGCGEAVVGRAKDLCAEY